MVRQAEAEQLAREQERKAVVRAFLKEHGYCNVDAPKQKMLKTKYPIHTAAKKGDPKIVAALLEERADPAQKKFNWADSDTNRTTKKQEWLSCRGVACLGRSLTFDDHFLACIHLYSELSPA